MTNKQIANKNKIALFFGGKISQHLVEIRKAAKKQGVELDLISYNRVVFDVEEKKIKIRMGNGADMGILPYKQKWIDISKYDVLFFRTTGKHWEEVNLILDAAMGDREGQTHGSARTPIVVDPLVLKGRPSDACKAYQMLALKRAGIEVPRTIYGSLWYLYEFMEEAIAIGQKSFMGARAFGSAPQMTARPKRLLTDDTWKFPVIVKGSGGDRGTRVFKADNLEDLEKLVRDLRKTETEEGKRYMLQEYIENKGDYRVLVLGDKVLGAMKRSSQSKEEFRNNYSAGGSVEIAELPQEIYDLASRAAKVCGLWIAGVDVMAKNSEQLSKNPKDYVILEVNKGPQFKGFMRATGIDVPAEIVKYLATLKIND